MKIYHVKAFCQNQQGGNPAGVVLNADAMSTSEMQALAKDINYSETAFVSKSNLADFKVRFFTPNSEVDLCGHATIATFHVLYEEKIIGPGHYHQETLAGRLAIDIDENGGIFMEQLLPESFGQLPKENIAQSLGIDSSLILDPIEIISTGLKDIIIQVKNSSVIKNLKLDFQKIKDISSDLKVVGYHVFSLHEDHAFKAHCRNFAPLYDINEEAATGTASGALTAYLVSHIHKNLEDGPYEWSYEQGVEMNQPSRIDVKFQIKDHKLSQLYVGGFASVQSFN